ncbi:MAG: MFS transporter [Devosia sp.]|uniref:MFS transporter n=1 Tax=Devosia sp. 66-22 TaxID=1895753 RepID=UPI0009287C17|nr:MFS transporter [Devosia sp. 66-22]MBN9346861.1 MFS transporter [Devosia sp.]OJX51734.1 MAG: MFS transporter [Devosia sp. 66-22]
MILAVALFMENMDSTVIATSLPAIAADIGTSPIALKLALTAYFVSLAIFIPISGWMADRFGSTNVFRAAIGVFMVGSICCAFSNSLETFVLSRFLQGVGGSMMTPIARLVLLRATPRNELVAATSWLSVPALLGPLTGPPVGGFLTTYLTWHWIFWINVPIGIIGILAATKFLPKSEPRTPRPIDLFGFLLTSIAFAGIIFGLSVISLPAIPVATGYVAVAVGAAAALLYLRHTRRAAFPLLDPKLFQRRFFRTTVVGGFFFRIGIGAFPFLMPLMLQLTFGLTPFESGMTTFVTAFGAIMSKVLAERVYARFGFPRTLTACAVLGVVFLGINGLFTPQTPHLLIMFCLFLGGVTRSFFFTGVNVFGYADVDETEASQATVISAVAQQISIALGVAVAGGLIEFTSRLHGGAPNLGDFHIAWFVVAGIAAISALFFWRLPPDAGADVSGHRARPLPVKPDPIA